jgi:hypothetical protein
MMMLAISIGLFVYYLTLKSTSFTQISQISQKYLTGSNAPPIPGDQQPVNTRAYESSKFLCTNLLPIPFPTQFGRPFFAPHTTHIPLQTSSFFPLLLSTFS